MMSNNSKRNTSESSSRDSISANIHRIDLTVVSELESDLEVNEIISLVFLLYDETHIAIERLKLLILTAGNSKICVSLLYDWVVKAQSNKHWRFELLEALAICQLYQFIRKLGFDVQQVQKHYLPHNLHLFNYVHPVRKTLYKLCESLHMYEYRALYTEFAPVIGELDIQKEPCEILFMKLINREHISTGHWSRFKGNEMEVGKVKKCNLKPLCYALNSIQRYDLAKLLTRFQTSTSELEDSEDDKSDNASPNFSNIPQDFERIFENKNEILERLPKVKVDHASDAGQKYKIKNCENVGICYIINQRCFHSEQDSDDVDDLEERLGSEKDVSQLSDTWEMLGFKVIIRENLRSNNIIPCIKAAIKKHFENEHSAFVLWILSHGRRGIIYGSNTKPVSIDEIKQTLCESPTLAGIPKIMFIQACQGTDSMYAFSTVKTDETQIHPTFKQELPALKGADLFLIQSSVPNYVSYRFKDGSLFVKTFCEILLKQCDSVDFEEIMVEIRRAITKYRYENQGQVSEYKTTSTKKLCLPILTR